MCLFYFNNYYNHYFSKLQKINSQKNQENVWKNFKTIIKREMSNYDKKTKIFSAI